MPHIFAAASGAYSGAMYFSIKILKAVLTGVPQGASYSPIKAGATSALNADCTPLVC